MSRHISKLEQPMKDEKRVCDSAAGSAATAVECDMKRAVYPISSTCTHPQECKTCEQAHHVYHDASTYCEKCSREGGGAWLMDATVAGHAVCTFLYGRLMFDRAHMAPNDEAKKGLMKNATSHFKNAVLRGYWPAAYPLACAYYKGFGTQMNWIESMKMNMLYITHRTKKLIKTGLHKKGDLEELQKESAEVTGGNFKDEMYDFFVIQHYAQTLYNL